MNISSPQTRSLGLLIPFVAPFKLEAFLGHISFPEEVLGVYIPSEGTWDIVHFLDTLRDDRVQEAVLSYVRDSTRKVARPGTLRSLQMSSEG